MPSTAIMRSASTFSSPAAAHNTAAIIPALQALHLHRPRPAHVARTCPNSRRTIFGFFGRKKKKATTPFEAALQKQSGRQEMLDRFQKPNTEGSIFSDELAEADKAQPKRDTSAGAASTPTSGSANKSRAGASLDPEHSARAVDPDPRARVRWERKMVIRSIRNGTSPWARESKEARIKRTERQIVSKSPFLPTSGKKLVHLAHQIQGKTLDDALLQMRFSPKKMAREVAVQLKLARDLAVVERGMGLGNVNGETQDWRDGIKKDAAAAASAASQPGNTQQMALAVVNGKQGQAGVKIQTKDKKWLHIDDPTRLYVSEAWIGRGPIRFRRLEYRAKGKANVLNSPSTSLTVVLKEEKTRIRQYQDRKTKEYRQGPWVHLPNRPVPHQRQHYSW